MLDSEFFTEDLSFLVLLIKKVLSLLNMVKAQIPDMLCCISARARPFAASQDIQQHSRFVAWANEVKDDGIGRKRRRSCPSQKVVVVVSIWESHLRLGVEFVVCSLVGWAIIWSTHTHTHTYNCRNRGEGGSTPCCSNMKFHDIEGQEPIIFYGIGFCYYCPISPLPPKFTLPF